MYGMDRTVRKIFRMTEEEAELLLYVAKREGRSMTDVICRAIKEYAKRYKHPKEL